MVKRYGRNQKRRHRAEREVLASMLDKARRNVAELQERQAELESSVERTAEIFGNYFAGLEPPVMPVRTLPGRYDRHALITRQPDFTRYTSAPDTPTDALDAINYAQTVLLTAEVIDDLSKQAHVMLSTPDGQLAYAFTPNAHRHMAREDFINLMGRMFARQLASSPAMNKILGDFKRSR